MLRIGIDLGGTKIEAIALAPDGQVLARRRIATPQGDYPATVGAVAALVEDIEAHCHARATVGVGHPGALDHRGLIKNANSTCLIGHPLQRDLQTLLQREVRLANDANCFALSEAVDGAGQGATSVFGVILGTGVGGGIVINGEPLVGANGIAGEWGHMPLPLPGGDDLPLPPCYCGRAGCIETYLSGPGLAADHRRHTPRPPGPVLDAPSIVARASPTDGVTADPACAATLARYEERLARGLAQVINLLDPEVIVLGGGLSAIARLYENVPRLWLPHVFSNRVVTRLVPPVHGDSSGVRGAAWLWPLAD